jgi:hypothetical protein
MTIEWNMLWDKTTPYFQKFGINGNKITKIGDGFWPIQLVGSKSLP